MSKTRIVVVQLKEIVYTGIFIGLGLLLILLLLIMFRPSDKTKDGVPATGDEVSYHAGIYTSQVSLGTNSINLEVVVDTNHINSIRFVNLEDTVTTMYPLIEPSLEKISDQLKSGTLLENISLDSENQYTQKLLVEAIDSTLSKAVSE